MTDSGWACPSCLRAWTVKQQPELVRPPRQASIPRKLWLPLAILVAALFCIGTYLELRRLSQSRQQHHPHAYARLATRGPLAKRGPKDPQQAIGGA